MVCVVVCVVQCADAEGRKGGEGLECFFTLLDRFVIYHVFIVQLDLLCLSRLLV